MSAPPRPFDGLEAGQYPHHAAHPGEGARHKALSEASRKIAINKISVMQALMISCLELALTLGNALDEDAFRFESGSDLIFGGSALIEAVGVLFAISMALAAFCRPATEDTAVGSGVRFKIFVFSSARSILPANALI